MTDFEQHRRRLRQALQHEGFPNMDYASPNSSVSSLSSSGDIVFSSPALAATRDNEVVIDFGAEEENDHSGIFAWPAVESPAAHSPAIRTTQRRSQTSSSTVSTPQGTTSINERWSQALAIAMNREADDPTTSLGRRIAARDQRLLQMQSQGQTAAPASEQFPTARLVSRTIIPVSEPEPPADLRRLATTREAERQLHYRDWHRLGLFDPSSPAAGSDNAGLSPGRLIPTATYARRRSRFPSVLDSNGDEQEDEGSLDMTQRLHRRSLVSDSQLEQIEREREPSSSNPRLIDPDRRLSRSRISIFGGRSYSRAPWYDAANDPNGEHFWDDDTPAARSRYWNARMSSATDDLLALATEILALLTRLQSSAAAERQHAPATPPGLGIPESGSRREHAAVPAPTKYTPSPLPSPLESMLLPTPRQRFIAAFKAGPNPTS